MSYLIELKDIIKSYQKGLVKTEVLHGISLNIHHKEFIGIIGSSGSGKSTLMNIIGLLDRPTTGSYLLDGKDINSYSITELANLRNQHIGFIFQSFFLLPALSVVENVGLPLTYQELPEEQILMRARLCLQRVGMEHLALRYPKELSGGQQQRIAIARSLVTKPSVILADEPTGALDSKTTQEILNLFFQLNMEDGNTIILITHDSKVSGKCPRVIEIADGLINNPLPT
ncbi:MAG: ABC transporter ATP-binding protein [Tatlockia sp.]|nr:ABC transporter ATP-binding protein [Tatlockia sp.]